MPQSVTTLGNCFIINPFSLPFTGRQKKAERQGHISSHFCLVAFNFEPVCSVGLMWPLFTRVLKIPYRVKFSLLYQSCPFLTLNLVFQDQRKDNRKHIQCRSIVSSENECSRRRKKKKIEKVLFFSIE